MGTPSATMLKYATYMSGKTGLFPGVIIAWLVAEQGWWTDNPGNFNSNNPLNLTGQAGAWGSYDSRHYPGGNPLSFLYFSTLKQGFDGCAEYFNYNAGPPTNWYKDAKNAATPYGQMIGLGNSPWDGAHYHNSRGNGGKLMDLFDSLPSSIKTMGVAGQHTIPEENPNRQYTAPNMHEPGVGVPLPTPPPQPNPMSLLKPQNYLAVIIVAILFFVMLNKR